MKNQALEAPTIGIVRTAGVLFLLSLLVPSLNWIFILSKFIVSDNVIGTAEKIVQNGFLFRLNIVNEMVSGIVAITLAAALYSLLKSVDKHLALTAFCFKLAEGIVSAMIAVGHLAAFLILADQPLPTRIESAYLFRLIGALVNNHFWITAISGIFLGVNLVIFLFLLYRSRYIPQALAGFGIISYALILVYDLSMVLFPEFTRVPIVQAVGWGPSILFELIIGSWLLVKGVDVRPETT